MSGTSLFGLGRVGAPYSYLVQSSLAGLPRQSRRQPLRGFASSTATRVTAGPALTVTSTQDAVVQPASHIGGGFEFLEPWTPLMQNLADTLHLSGPHAHALSIVALAFTMRTLVTLPITLWQRGKTRKLTEKVLPEWNKEKERIPFIVRARCRKSGKSYEEFVVEVNKTMKERLAQLLRKHGASALPGFVIPAAINIPIFLLMTALLRQAALDPSTPFAAEVIPWWSPSPELAAQFKVSANILADRGLEPETIARMQGSMGGPTLADRDPTMIGPISFGMLTMANTELSSWSRRTLAKIDATAGNSKGDYPAEKPDDIAAQTAKQLLDDPDQHETRRGRIISNALRVLAIAFIPIAMQAPGVIIVYWLSSGVYTLAQNSVLAVLDKRYETQRARKQATR